MRWSDLMSTRRLGRTEPRQDDQRSPFEVDVDRFVFCSAFRRLQSKMQVHGPSLDPGRAGIEVRNRLTHSIEVSRVGRSLGQLAGQYLAGRGLLGDMTAAEVGHVVSGAAISHDIGQTPFSHEAEEAISAWWRESPLGQSILDGLPVEFRHELTQFDGNGFGFRLLTRLEGWHEAGGLQLTAALLGAFTKYPWSGGLPPAERPYSTKFGFFSSELALFEVVADATGLIRLGPARWCRHPLAYLTEAADDICYLVVDIEDAVEIGALAFEEAEVLLAPIAGIDAAVYDRLDGTVRKLTYLRSRAISALIAATAEAWRMQHDTILRGEDVPPLLGQTPFTTALDEISEISRRRIYRAASRSDTVLLANRTISVLLDHFAGMLLRRETAGQDQDLSILDQAILSVLSRSLDPPHSLPRDRAAWVRAMMDHICALTEPAAMGEARLLTGGLGA